MHELLAHGVSLICRGELRRGEQFFRDLPPRGSRRCTSRRRPTCCARASSTAGPNRHPVHYDGEAADEIVARAAAGEWEPLPLPGVLLRLDTTNGFDFDAAALLKQALAAGHVTLFLMIAVIGNLSRDLVPDRPPSVGGGPFHAARALHRLRVPARLVARCASEDCDTLLPPVIRLGTPRALRARRADSDLLVLLHR